MLTYETFALPKAAAHALMQGHKSQDDLHTAILAEYAAQRATLEIFTIVRTKSGQRAKVEAIDEYPYPTDYDPPQISQTLHLGAMGGNPRPKKSAPPAATPPAPPAPPAAVNATADPAVTAPMVAPEKSPPRAPSAASSNSGLGNMTNITPTTFSVRNIGFTLEVDPVIGEDGKTVDLTLAPEVVKVIGSQARGHGLNSPVFRSQKFNTSITMSSGHPMFLGTQHPPLNSGVPGNNTTDQVWLSFVTPKVVALAMPPKPVAPPTPATSGQLQFRWETISLPSSEAHKLMATGVMDGELYRDISELLKTGTAKLETVVSLLAKSGQRCKAEHIEEYEYPTDMDPPQTPQTLTITDPDLLADLRAGGKVGALAEDLPKGNLGFGLITSTTATTFQVRNVGDTIELDPVIGEDGYTIDFNVAPECVRLIGSLEYAGIKQPMFETQKLGTALTGGVGIPCFIGTMNRPVKTGAPSGNQEDRVVFAFLTGERP